MKKIIAVALCVALVFSCLAFSADADDDGFVFVYNDSIVFGSAENAPVTESGTVYIPIDFIFPYIKATYVIEDESNAVNVFFDGVTIAFDTSSGLAITSDNRYLYEKLPYIDGKYYISLALIAREDAHVFTTLSGGVCRLKNSSATKSDTDLNKLLNIMPSSSAYRGKTPSYYFIAFGAGTQTTRQLGVASSHGASLAVFITDTDITNSPQAVCALMVSGCPVGIYPSDSFMASGRSDEQIADELQRINNLLYRLTRQYTSLCALHSTSTKLTPALSETLSARGLKLWGASLLIPDDFSSSVSENTINKMWNNISSYITWDMCIELADTALATSVYDLLLDNITAVRTITAGKTPVCCMDTVTKKY